jgi:CRP/FNR family cyclic AMP-dependent transcriptional regulator
VILTGSAKVVRNPGNGPEKILALCGPGSLIGELASLTGAPRSAAVRALERVGALVISDVEFAGAARHDPGLHGQLALALAEQLLVANQLLTDTSLPAALPRLAAVLASLGEQLAGTGRKPVVLPVSQTELASLAATSEASVVRSLRTLRTMSLVHTGRRRVVLTDPLALRRYAERE